jgi:hypothetical protein
MASLTYSFNYRNFDVTIVGFEVPGGWRLAVEIRSGDDIQVFRDSDILYPDFNSLKSMGIWQAYLMVNKKSGSHG